MHEVNVKTVNNNNNSFSTDSSGNYVDNSGNTVKGKTEAGFIAQEMLNTDLSWLVSGGGTIKKSDISGNMVDVQEMHGINYDSLHAYSIKAILELKQLVDNLTNRIATLEGN